MWSVEKPSEGGALWANPADVAGRAARRDHVVTSSSFEETYPKHEFSELVRLGLALGGWIIELRRFIVMRQPEPSALPPGDIAAAD